MEEQNISDLVVDNQPIAYLDRLGKLYNGHAGLGDAAVHTHDGKPQVIYMPVFMSTGKEVKSMGVYIIKLNDNLDAVALSYSGDENKSGMLGNSDDKYHVKLDADITPQGIIRTDSYTDIPLISSDTFAREIWKEDVKKLLSAVVAYRAHDSPEQPFYMEPGVGDKIVNPEHINDTVMSSPGGSKYLPEKLALDYLKKSAQK